MSVSAVLGWTPQAVALGSLTLLLACVIALLLLRPGAFASFRFSFVLWRITFALALKAMPCAPRVSPRPLRACSFRRVTPVFRLARRREERRCCGQRQKGSQRGAGG